MNISVASSVSAEKNFDPIDTIEFCTASNIKQTQLYMDDSLKSDKTLIRKLAEKAYELNIKLTCHAPGLHRDSDVDSDTFKAIATLLKFQDRKIVITHFDENITPKESAKVVSKINDFGLTVGLENFYQDKILHSVNKNITDYIKTLHLCNNQDIIPVIDLPRLFIDPISKNGDSYTLTKKLLEGLSKTTKEIILHIIDFNDFSQSRDSWVEIGSGLMPYNEISKNIKSLGLNINHAVLEFEGKGLIFGSIKALSDIF